MAVEQSAAQYAAAENKIATELTTAKAACLRLSISTRESCLASAMKNADIATAELEAEYQPSSDERIRAQVAKAEADFAAAKQHCDNMTGTAQASCIRAAQTAEATSKANADKYEPAGVKPAEATPRASAMRSDGNMRATDTLFDFDSADLRPAGRTSLNEFVNLAKSSGSGQISVIGYTDRIGSEAYNQQLSERRVETVKNYLVSEGIQVGRISVEGMGQAQPVTSTDECMSGGNSDLIACLQPDRRVVVSMTGITSSR